jgi:FkbM family methyltransferase
MILDFTQLIKKYNMNINGVIHIGAHYGEEHELYKQNNINNIVYFEPLKSNYEILTKNVVNEAICYNLALGNDNKEVEMFVETANNSQSSSVLEPCLHLQQYPHITFDYKEKVQMKKLDDFNFGKEFNFINIDVQGFELEVFKGAEKTLQNVDYIISEINRAEVYKDCAKVEELYTFLSKFGFKLYEVDWMGYIWGDGLFIKNNY